MPLACSSLVCVVEINSDSALSYCKEQQLYVFLYAYYVEHWVFDITGDISSSCLFILSQSHTLWEIHGRTWECSRLLYLQQWRDTRANKKDLEASGVSDVTMWIEHHLQTDNSRWTGDFGVNGSREED